MQQTASDAYEQSEENKDDIMQLKSDLAGVTDTVKVLQSNYSSLKDYIVAQDTYSRRDNLLFDNVPDSKNTNPVAWYTCKNNSKWQKKMSQKRQAIEKWY